MIIACKFCTQSDNVLQIFTKAENTKLELREAEKILGLLKMQIFGGRLWEFRDANLMMENVKKCI